MSLAVSMRNVDPAFQGAGQKAYPSLQKLTAFHVLNELFSLTQYAVGLKSGALKNHALFPFQHHHMESFSLDNSSVKNYLALLRSIVMDRSAWNCISRKTFASKTGVLRHEIHYWLGKDTSQDEAGAAAVKTIELDAALGGRALQYREVQGNESDKFLSLFKPCIMPQEGGIATGFKHVEESEYKTRLLVCKGKHIVPFARSTLNHDNIFILDTKPKIFQFNGSNTSIQERAKALGVAQYIRDNYHDGKCEIASIEDGKLMADAASGEFWALFGGYAPLLRKSARDEDTTTDSLPTKKLLSVEKGKAEPVEADFLKRELLATDKCYILDCGLEVYVWMGRSTSLDERKTASKAAEELIQGSNRSKSHLIRVIEGFETVIFRSKFDSWPQTTNATVTEDGRGKVAALLQRQGLNVKGLLKVDPVKEEPEEHIDCTGQLQVWRVNGEDKVLLSAENQSKFYSGDCYIFQYSYSGDDKEEHLIGTWFGKQSIEKERASAISMANKMVESMKFMVAQACIHEGSESLLFFLIFQSFIMFKGGLSDGYKNHIAEKGIPDDTYTEDGLALFRVQGSGPENMQAIQVEAVASSLNSSYCYILHSGTTVFTWNGSMTSPDDQDLVERQLDLIKPELQTRPQKEGAEFDQFWELLGGKAEHPSEKISRVPEGDPHLFSCTFSKAEVLLQVTEIYNFTQDDLMTEDIFILDCHSNIFVWVGQQVDTKNKSQALTIGKVRPDRLLVKFIEHDFLFEKLSRETPIYVVMEGSEPPFFTRFFTWDAAKSNMHGNSFQRKLDIMKHGGTPVDKPKRRVTAFGGRSSSTPEKPQRSRSVSFSPDRPRVRGRSPAFNKLAANFENPKDRNFSTPPPMVSKLYTKSGTQEVGTKSAAIAALTQTFDRAKIRESLMPRTVKASPAASKATAETNTKESSRSSRLESLSIQEGIKEGENEDDGDEEGVPIYPYERLKTTSEDPVTEIDVTKRETYLSSAEFKEKLGMKRAEFYKLPKWKQNKLKMGVQLF
ncbi:Villin-4 [Hibiscus syriacus]|uniref:Villin-4 n=1 Tax=Hibiscus syriacus TaxID=106335 RepID=A0A6A3B2C9_HIBSY|nr:Villin-4 [Hibiscus syriacus]